MAHGFLQSFDQNIEVFSAGIHPAEKVHPTAIRVMAEVGIDISHHIPKSVDHYLNESWDYVITVCGGANESCPMFTGEVAHPIKSVASLPKYQRYTIEKERYVPNSTQLASKCLKLGVE